MRNGKEKSILIWSELQMTDAKGKGAKINITEHFQKRTDSKLRGKQSTLQSKGNHQQYIKL